ncbi:hypothetical protein INR75_11375 [Zunongwangia sp. SCSIO 43204]|uniref:hypothetical protein n=1 Tax=Zunongwangia sp. SCSIO 43204 TaxID=2779359 RepID=UPI001CA7E51F|nr:hypothetical protein [Zunongwangia sp. SCSIO 43204]UAB82835.1 hypothetical protein INR75_11375 [Zunongwangia sp. SCSIO 43204]
MKKLEVQINDHQFGQICQAINSSVPRNDDAVVSGNLDIILSIDSLNIHRARLLLNHDKKINCGWVDYQLKPIAEKFQELECFKSLNKTEAFYKMLEVGFVKQAFLELLGYGNYNDFEINLHGKRCITCNDALTILFVLLEEPNDAVTREICESFYLIDHFKTKLILIDRSFKVGDIEHTTLSSHKISERCIQNEVPENNLFLQYIQILFQ